MHGATPFARGPHGEVVQAKCRRHDVRPVADMSDAKTRLVAVLTRLGAPHLPEKVWTVGDLHELPEGVRGEILDVLGHEAAQKGFDRDGDPNAYGDELNELAAALLDEP